MKTQKILIGVLSGTLILTTMSAVVIDTKPAQARRYDGWGSSNGADVVQYWSFRQCVDYISNKTADNYNTAISFLIGMFGTVGIVGAAAYSLAAMSKDYLFEEAKRAVYAQKGLLIGYKSHSSYNAGGSYSVAYTTVQ